MRSGIEVPLKQQLQGWLASADHSCMITLAAIVQLVGVFAQVTIHWVAAAAVEFFSITPVDVHDVEAMER